MADKENFLLNLRQNSNRTRSQLAIEMTQVIGDDEYKRNEKHVAKFEKNFNSLGPLDIKAYNTIFNIDLLEAVIQTKPKVQAPLFRIEGSPTRPDKDYTSSVIDKLRLIKGDDKASTLIQNLESYQLKPTVALFGRFDSGKTTLLNFLFQSTHLKTSYGETTNFTLLICHREDRPLWWGEEDFHLYGPEFEPLNRFNQEYCERFRKMKGSSKLVIDISHKNENSDFARDCFGILYIDSPILKLCNFIDTPGFSSANKDDNAQTEKLIRQTSRQQNIFDIALLLSPCNTFLDKTDLSYAHWLFKKLGLSWSEKGLKNAENFFIVATHKPSNFEEWQEELETNVRKLSLSTSPTVGVLGEDLQSVQALTNELVRRVFPFSPKPGPDQTKFAEALQETIEKRIVANRTSLKKNLKKEMKKYRSQIESDIKTVNNIKDINFETDPELVAKFDAIITKIDQSRKKFSIIVREKLEHYDRDRIISMIANVFKDNRKDAEAQLPSYLQAVIERELNVVLASMVQEVNKLIDELIGELSLKANKVKIGKDAEADEGFDGKAAFLSGLAGLATFGGLAAWAATFGNLGGYILVAKGASVLASIGLATGGTASAIAAVSAIGGPVTLAVGLAVVAIFSVWRLLSDNWQTRLANKLVKSLEQSGYEKYYDKFWLDTNNAFIRAYSELSSAARSYVKTVHDLEQLKKNKLIVSEIEEIL